MFSFIIPVRNVPVEYFSYCINSINVAARKINYEIIVCNDGSDKIHTKKYEKFLLENKSKIKYFKVKQSKGINFVRNICISNASGDWIALVDADDAVTDDYVDKISPLFSSDAALIYADHYQYNESLTQITQVRKKSVYHNIYLNFGNTEFDPLLWATYIFHPQIYSKKAMLEIGLFNTMYSSGDEVDAHIKISEKYGISLIRHIPEVLYKYRKNSLSVVHNSGYYQRLIHNIESILSYYYKKRGINNSYTRRVGRAAQTNAAHYRHYWNNGQPIDLPWFNFDRMEIVLKK